MSQPLVSIVLCTYNGEKFLEQQVDSILRQSYRPIELIISDDASEDGTGKLIEKYAKHPEVRVYHQPVNMGLTHNFAFAASKTKGELIAFSDQDDIWEEKKIETLVSKIGNSPLVYSDSLLVNETGESMNRKLSDLKRMYSGDDSRCYVLYSCVWGHGMLITRKLLEQSLPMPAEIHHDIWIVFQAFMNGGIKYHDEVLTYYRQHSESTSQTLPEKNSSRKRDSHYEAYLKKLRWIELMRDHERAEYKPFYNELYRLYSQKKFSYVFPLVSFMLKHRDALFRLSPKGFLSQFVEIIKQARREKE